MKTAPRASPALRQVGKGLGALDAEVFEAIANSRSPLLDTVMPALSRAADNGKLWFAIAAAMGLSGKLDQHKGCHDRTNVHRAVSATVEAQSTSLSASRL
jgi:hypothetical protein